MISRKHAIRFCSAAGLVGVAGAANAAIDFTAITAVVDTTTVLAALAAIAALKFAVPFTKWAYRQVTGMFGRG